MFVKTNCIYIFTNGMIRPKITWFSITSKNLTSIPYYVGSKTFGDIVSFARDRLDYYTAEPNTQV